jgi:hypothetical protein
MRWVWHVACTEANTSAHNILVGDTEGGRPLEVPGYTCKDNIRMDLKEIEWGGGVDWIHLTQDRDHWWTLVNK